MLPDKELRLIVGQSSVILELRESLCSGFDTDESTTIIDVYLNEAKLSELISNLQECHAILTRDNIIMKF